VDSRSELVASSSNFGKANAKESDRFHRPLLYPSNLKMPLRTWTGNIPVARSLKSVAKEPLEQRFGLLAAFLG
jgi:hypothetical protein